MKTKAITVIPATGGAYRDITIEPGTTAQDVKQALGLPKENVLTKGRGAEPIPDDENLFETLADGAKLYATTAVEWGGSFLQWLLDMTTTATAPTAPTVATSPVQVHRTYTPLGSQTVTVLRNPRPYWVERGWARNGEGYSGNYITDFGKWPGWISQSASGRVEAYIAHPPAALEGHPHWPCFRKRADGWFFIHPVNDVPDVSAAILAVEKTLAEAFNAN